MKKNTTTTLASMVLLVLVCGYQPNLGPNIQYPSPPLNPTVQSIHPR